MISYNLPDYIHKGSELAAIIGYVCSTLAILVRLYTKIWLSKRMKLEDCKCLRMNRCVAQCHEAHLLQMPLLSAGCDRSEARSSTRPAIESTVD